MTPDEALLLEEHLRQRIEAVREDMRLMEARLEARLAAVTTRTAAIESWQNQVVGASKAGRIIWTAAAGLLIGLFTLWTWVYEHFIRHH